MKNNKEKQELFSNIVNAYNLHMNTETRNLILGLYIHLGINELEGVNITEFNKRSFLKFKNGFENKVPKEILNELENMVKEYIK